MQIVKIIRNRIQIFKIFKRIGQYEFKNDGGGVVEFNKLFSVVLFFLIEFVGFLLIVVLFLLVMDEDLVLVMVVLFIREDFMFFIVVVIYNKFVVEIWVFSYE